MRAIFKSKLIIEFDRAIRDAKDSECEISFFELESEEENKQLRAYVNLQDAYNAADDYDYDGILVKEYVASIDAVDARGFKNIAKECNYFFSDVVLKGNSLELTIMPIRGANLKKLKSMLYNKGWETEYTNATVISRNVTNVVLTLLKRR